jgi:hypothetical protein
MQNTSDVHAKLAAVCPIVGVCLNNTTDKSKWTIDFDPSATPGQIVAANALLASIDPLAPPPPPPKTIAIGDLVALLVAKGHLTAADVAAIQK